jgi:hypothetical protein
MTDLSYYVYVYIRDDGTPYYIGKGKGRRAYAPHKKNIAVPKDKSKILFMETNLSEVGALALERRYIEWYGRKCDGSGILRNIGDGGEGHSGRVISEETKRKQSNTMKLKAHWRGKPLLEATKKKISDSKKGIKLTDEHKQNISDASKGRVFTPETREKLRQANLGISRRGSGFKLSEETKSKMSASKKGVGLGVPMKEATKIKIGLAHKGKPIKQLICPHCNAVGYGLVMMRWHFNNCKQYRGN